MNPFPKRYYSNPRQLWNDVAFLFKHHKQMRVALRGKIPHAFRERLMMAVTAVNQCRYCAYFHSHVALASGIAPHEIEQILQGEFADAPVEEIPALVYAHHWAETNAQPDPTMRAQFIATYGNDTAQAIEFVLRVIRVGNLMGNLGDYLLYRLSFGRWGLQTNHRVNALVERN